MVPFGLRGEHLAGARRTSEGQRQALLPGLGVSWAGPACGSPLSYKTLLMCPLVYRSSVNKAEGKKSKREERREERRGGGREKGRAV